MLQAGSIVQQRILCAITAVGSGTGESSAGKCKRTAPGSKKTPNPQQPPHHRPGGKKKADEVGVSEGDPHYNKISINT